MVTPESGEAKVATSLLALDLPSFRLDGLTLLSSDRRHSADPILTP
jgi:hypothetical protein